MTATLTTPASHWASVTDAFTGLVGSEHPVAIGSSGATAFASVADQDWTVTASERPDWLTIDAHQAISTTVHRLRTTRYRLSENGWSTSSDRTPTSVRLPALTLPTKQSTTVSMHAWNQHVDAYTSAPDVTEILVGLTADGVHLAARSSAIQSAAVFTTSDNPARPERGFAVPAPVLAAAGQLLDDDVVHLHVNPARSRLALVGHRRTVAVTIRGTDTVEWPVRPAPNLRRHDVVLSSAVDFAAIAADHSLSRHRTAAMPTMHIRLESSPGQEQHLHLLTKVANRIIDQRWRCSSADDFGVDLPYPAFVSALAPAAGLREVLLRHYDPNPQRTYLIVDYADDVHSGYTVVGARAPSRG